MKQLIWIIFFLGFAGLVQGCAMDSMSADKGFDDDQGDPWPDPDPKIWLYKNPPSLDPSLTLIVQDVVIFEAIEGIDAGAAVDPPGTPEIKQTLRE